MQIQISLGHTDNDYESNNKITDKYSCGYIFGLCDSLLQSFGIDDEVESMALIAIIHVSLFGEKNGTSIASQSFGNQGDSIFRKGMMKGGQELVEFFNNKTPAMGLAKYLSGSETY